MKAVPAFEKGVVSGSAGFGLAEDGFAGAFFFSGTGLPAAGFFGLTVDAGPRGNWGTRADGDVCGLFLAGVASGGVLFFKANKRARPIARCTGFIRSPFGDLAHSELSRRL
jgi:hypothetical protein